MSPAVSRIILQGGFNPYRLPGVAARYDSANLQSLIYDSANRVSQWNDLSGNGRHLTQGTGAAQPRLLPFAGTNYAYLPGVAGNYLSTPDSAAVSITGDIDLRIQLSLVDWTPSATQALVNKWKTNSNLSYTFYLSTDGKLHFAWSAAGAGGTDDLASSVATGFTDGTTNWLRVTFDVDNGAAGRTATFYTSSDGTTWTPLGTAQTTAGVTSIFDGTSDVQVGGQSRDSWYTNGNVYYAEIRNGIGGTVVAKMDASQAAHNATSWTSSAGEVWTVNQSGATPAQIVGASSVLYDAAAFKMAVSYASIQPRTLFFVGCQRAWTIGKYIMDGTSANTLGVSKTTSSPRISLNAGSAGAENANLTLGAFKATALILNGVASSIQVRGTVATTGDSGAGNPGGLTLGADGAGANYGSIQVSELIDVGAVLTQAQIDRTFEFLARKWPQT